jgi:hypothetical protein
MGIASVLRRNQDMVGSIADTINAYRARERKEAQQRELAAAIAKHTTKSRVPKGTTTFGTDAGAAFEPLSFEDRTSVHLGGILDDVSQDNPLVGSYLERALMKRDLERMDRPTYERRELDGILYEIPINATTGQAGSGRALTQPRVKPTPTKEPKITTRIVKRTVDGKPMQFERTYRDGVYTGEEEEIGEEFVKPDKPPAPGDLSDRDKQAAEELRARKKRIAELTQRNLVIGQEMALLSANADADKDGELSDTEKANLQMLKESLQNELTTNEQTLDQLNREIGGTWRKKDGSGTPAGRADSPAVPATPGGAVVTPTKSISLKAARAAYGNKAAKWTDERLKTFLESNGYQVTE